MIHWDKLGVTENSPEIKELFNAWLKVTILEPSMPTFLMLVKDHISTLVNGSCIQVASGSVMTQKHEYNGQPTFQIFVTNHHRFQE